VVKTGHKLRLLDLFCGAGGAAVGYHRAGFDEIVGVDIKPMPRYPFTFVQADALEYCAAHGREFDAIHASPPCQAYSALRCLPWLRDRVYPDLMEATRATLRMVSRPYVIENVARAPMQGVVLCGRSFGLPVFRHRRFESNIVLLQPPHSTHDQVIGKGRMVNDRRKGTLNAGSNRGAWGRQSIITVAGGQCRKDEAERALGIDWMLKPELMQAIPPAYTEYIGLQLMAYLRHENTVPSPRMSEVGCQPSAVQSSLEGTSAPKGGNPEAGTP
jgi:DNA (cytosine-5)-methyltransferase 1